MKLTLSSPRAPSNCASSLHNFYTAELSPLHFQCDSHPAHTPHPNEHTCRPHLHPPTPCLPWDLQESLVRGKQAGSPSCARPPFSMCENKCVCIYVQISVTGCVCVYICLRLSWLITSHWCWVLYPCFLPLADHFLSFYFNISILQCLLQLSSIFFSHIANYFLSKIKYRWHRCLSIWMKCVYLCTFNLTNSCWLWCWVMHSSFYCIALNSPSFFSAVLRLYFTLILSFCSSCWLQVFAVNLRPSV